MRIPLTVADIVFAVICVAVVVATFASMFAGPLKLRFRRWRRFGKPPR